jgi:predicted Kef-type K+ transport protein
VFLGGLLFKLIQLPPLAGFLAAGFVLNALGVNSIPAIDVLANFGVTLLLFTIGLKINLKNLLKFEILASSSMQAVGCILAAVVLIKIFVFFGIYQFANLSIMQAFYISLALSFSSTVCAVKTLEDKNELKTRHGQITLSILVIQDIIAVLFLSSASGKWPSAGAFLLFLLPLCRPLISRLLQKAEHGEMLPLAGIFLAFSGGELFNFFDVKADLGALIFGMLLSQDKKAAELSKSLLAFKDLFLIAFFLSIGFTSLPTFETFISALLLLFLLFAKSVIFFFSLVLCKVRARTAFLTSLVLSNFSEFGLIVAVECQKQGWLSSDWLMIIAIAAALSFVATSILNKKAHGFYTQISPYIKGFQSDRCLEEDVFHQPTNTEILVVGMGRVGRGAYDSFERHGHGLVWGIDANKPHIDRLIKLGYLATVGDAEDADFWEQVNLSSIHLIMLTMPSHQDMVEVVKQIRRQNFQGKIAGIAKYEDQRKELIDMGVDVAFNFYAEAGAGFAEESLHLLDNKIA